MANNTGFSFQYLIDDIENISDIDTYIDQISHAVDKKIALRIGVSEIHVDHIALHQALVRYSKDVYGYSRVETILNNTNIDKAELPNILDTIKTSGGFMLETNDPHINKQLAYLAYHLSCMKPFSVIKMDKNFKTSKYTINYIENHFNEIVIYCIMIFILAGRIHIVLSEERLRYLFHAMRFRNITRSSLEIVFENILQDEQSINIVFNNFEYNKLQIAAKKYNLTIRQYAKKILLNNI